MTITLAVIGGIILGAVLMVILINAAAKDVLRK